MKHKQTIRMLLSLLLVIAFFLPWFGMNPDMTVFAASNSQYSGFQLLMAFSSVADNIFTLVSTFVSKNMAFLIYLVYVLFLIPLLGILAIVLSGLRKKHAGAVHLTQYIFTGLILTVFFIGLHINPDIKTLFESFFRIGYGFWISLLAAASGIVISFIK